MGLSEELARGSLRLTVGKDNTMEEIDRLLEVLPPIVVKLRDLSPLWRQADEEGSGQVSPPGGN
jgi:cysteine desulfurase